MLFGMTAGEASRLEILKIHAAGITKRGDIDYESVVKLAEGFNGADLRNICTGNSLITFPGNNYHLVILYSLRGWIICDS